MRDFHQILHILSLIKSTLSGVQFCEFLHLRFLREEKEPQALARWLSGLVLSQYAKVVGSVPGQGTHKDQLMDA